MIVYHINIATKTLKPGAVKNRPLFKRVQTWIQFFFSIFQLPVFGNVIDAGHFVSGRLNGFCTEQLVGQILTSSHQVMLGRSSKHKRHPRQGNTSITEQHLAEMIRDQDICGEWWAEWYGDPPLAQPHSHTRVRKEKRKKSLFVILFCLAFLG